MRSIAGELFVGGAGAFIWVIADADNSNAAAAALLPVLLIGMALGMFIGAGAQEIGNGHKVRYLVPLIRVCLALGLLAVPISLRLALDILRSSGAVMLAASAFSLCVRLVEFARGRACLRRLA